MKLAEIKEFLGTYKQIMITATLDDESLVKIWIEKSYGQNNPNPLEVRFKNEEGSHIDEMDWEFLEHILTECYKSWEIDARDVAIWNYYQNKKEWVEVSKEYYWDCLETVPPAYHRNMVFACGEPYTYNNSGDPVYFFFKADNGKYWVQLMSKKEFLASK